MSEASDRERSPIEPEDQARADFYALLARLFANAPNATLLRSIAEAGPLTPVAGSSENGNPAAVLAEKWNELRSASHAIDWRTASFEYDALFVGVGRSEVSLYASHYLGPQSGRPLAEIRSTLADLGLARRSDSSEFEDHISVILETMRMLISGDGDRAPTGILCQRNFFETHVVRWTDDCCDAIVQSPIANYYRQVAQFAKIFLALERDSLAMD